MESSATHSALRAPRLAPRAPFPLLSKPRSAPRTNRLANGFWSLLIVGLIAWHAAMTLQLFGPENPWQNLTNEQPIITGRHALHLYHGYLGARSFLTTFRLSCCDPNFQALYPKTPVF